MAPSTSAYSSSPYQILILCIAPVLSFQVLNSFYFSTVGYMSVHGLSISKDISSCTQSHSRYLRDVSVFYEGEESEMTCPPCKQMHCFRRRPKPLRCNGGITLGICGCCRVCAKTEGQLCGGQHDYLGKCDRNLYCEPQIPQIVHFSRDGEKRIYKVTRGLCKKVPSPAASVPLENQNFGCRPLCDSEFCAKHPRAICSARENVMNKLECHGPCHHTSCRACRFMQLDMVCPKCSKGNFKCLRNFGRCLRKTFCQKTQHLYPCQQMPREKSTRGKFLCQVPECLFL